MSGPGYSTLKETFLLMKSKGSDFIRPVEVSEKLGISGQLAFEALKELRNRGIVKKSGRGRYILHNDVLDDEDYFPKISMAGIKYPIEIWSYHKFLNQLLKQTRHRHNSSSLKQKKHVDENDLTIGFLLELWENQNGRCALTGIPMTTVRGNGWQIPTNASIDQIVHRQGYTQNNVRLICWQANMMRGQLTDEELIIFCKLIFEKRNGRQV